MRRVTLAAATVAALVATLGAPAHAGAGPTPGAPGVGDTYYPDYGNGGYDVGHYDLKLKYRPKTDELFGTATITATATQQLSSFNLDFALDVASVTVNGKAATFSKALSHELVITPKNPLHNHEAMTVVVKYSGIPSSVKVNGFTSWKRTSDGAEAINEPEIAWWWYPSNDQPQDKATYDISVAVPDGTQVVSNGVMTGPPVTTGGWTAWNWTSAKPMNTYSAFVVMGQYDILQSTAPNGQPFVSAFSKNIQNAVTEANARAAVARTPEILAFEETQFGPYPFEAQGGVVGPVDGQGFALECQTRPVYGPGFFRNRVNTSVVAHENAHQWFGGSVSVHNWQDIWLNEGFATYAQWLWSEHEGQGTVQELFDATYASYPVDSAFWQVLPGNPGSDKQFDDAVYDRGAMALQQLRLAVGDKEFFTVLKGWTKHKQYKDGSIAEFRAYAERITETDLHAVFDTWLFTPGRPALAAPARAAVAPAQPASLVEIRESREH